MSTARKDMLIEVASLAYTRQRYEDMLEAMRAAVATGHELSGNERKLLFIAYSCVLNQRALSWPTYLSREGESEERQELVECYQENIENELAQICRDMLHLLDTYLIPSASSPNKRVSYLTMKGTYYKHLSQLTKSRHSDTVVEDAQEAYETASALSKKEMYPSDANTLRLALKFSIFYYEILKCTKKACEIAENAMAEALDDMDIITDEMYWEVDPIMQALMRKINIWRAEMETEPQELPEADDAAMS